MVKLAVKLLLITLSLLVLSLYFASAANKFNCHYFYWLDDNQKTCDHKEFCGAFMYPGLRTYATLKECQASSLELCPYYYWSDKQNKNCDKKRFCGNSTYEGLIKFKTKEECKIANGEVDKNNSFDTNFCVTDDDCELQMVCCTNNCVKKPWDQIDCDVICTDKMINRTIKECKCENNRCIGYPKNITKVKIMPETASARAIERLGQLNFTIELREVGNENQKNNIYVLNADKDMKIIGLFKTKAKFEVQINAETGDVIKVKKPWWLFLANEIKSR